MTADARIGTTLQGKYAIERVLGEGGMGIVYGARHVRLDRPVAIKFLHTAYARDRSALGRFFDEARAAGSLHHPNVVGVHDVDSDGDTPFMVLEWLRGETLAEHLRQRGALPASEAVALLDPVLDGLAAAHARGIVHRDLKPENIFLAREGDRIVPKLLDFGIAKLRDGASGAATATGTTVGTPTYMAPEQARGSVREIGPWTDVWAMGVVLFECISGRMHFDFAPEAGVLGWLGQVATGRPRSLREVAPAVPQGIADAIDRALEIDPTRRTQSVAALRAELRGVVHVDAPRAVSGTEHTRLALSTPGRHAVPATRDMPSGARRGGPQKHRSAAPWMVGAIALALLGASTVIALFATGGSDRDERPSDPPQQATVDRASTTTMRDAGLAAPDASVTATRREPTVARQPAKTQPAPEPRGGPARRAARSNEPPEARREGATQPRPATGGVRGRERSDRAARTRSGAWNVDEL